MDFTVTAGKRTWTLSLEAVAPTPASPLTTPRVRVRLQDGPPSAKPATVFESVLRSSDVTVGTDSAWVSTRVGGVPLRIEWLVPGAVPSGVTVNTAVVGVGRLSRARVQLGAASCISYRAAVGVRVVSLMDLQEPVGPVDRALPSRSLRGARCAEAAYPTAP